MTVVVAFSIGLVILGVASVIGMVAAVRAKTDASRAVISDLLFFAGVSAFVPIAALTGSAVVFDVALLATMLGILTTLALGQILTRGRR